MNDTSTSAPRQDEVRRVWHTPELVDLTARQTQGGKVFGAVEGQPTPGFDYSYNPSAPTGS